MARLIIASRRTIVLSPTSATSPVFGSRASAAMLRSRSPESRLEMDVSSIQAGSAATWNDLVPAELWGGAIAKVMVWRDSLDD